MLFSPLNYRYSLKLPSFTKNVCVCSLTVCVKEAYGIVWTIPVQVHALWKGDLT